MLPPVHLLLIWSGQELWGALVPCPPNQKYCGYVSMGARFLEARPPPRACCCDTMGAAEAAPALQPALAGVARCRGRIVRAFLLSGAVSPMWPITCTHRVISQSGDSHKQKASALRKLFAGRGQGERRLLPHPRGPFGSCAPAARSARIPRCAGRRSDAPSPCRPSVNTNLNHLPCSVHGVIARAAAATAVPAQRAPPSRHPPQAYTGAVGRHPPFPFWSARRDLFRRVNCLMDLLHAKNGAA